MCGIVGVGGALVVSRRGDLEGVLTAANDALAHRGPDAAGTWTAARTPIALGHRRLAVIDLSAAAGQPMTLPGGSDRVITFNGEIYNHRELRRSLEADGVAFRTQSDTEVLLAACAVHGVIGALERVRGMFAFAYYDEDDGAIWLARDRFGEKPLYWATWAGTLAFGSELKALRTLPGFPTELAPESIELLMRHSCIGGDRTIYRAAHKVLPGTVLRIPVSDRITEDDVRELRYWDPVAVADAARADRFRGTLDDAADQLDELLGRSVVASTVSDVPVGALLSGGVDSTTVVSQLVRRADGTPRTFTIGFGSDYHSEADAARQIAKHLGTHHTELILTSSDALAVIPRLPEMFDEPFADSSQIPTFLISQLARKDVTVALTGDGGDEVFGGYPRFRLADGALRKLSRVPRGARNAIARTIERRTEPFWNRAGHLLDHGRLRRLSGGLDERAAKAAAMLRADSPDDVYRLLVTSFWERSIVPDAPDPPPRSLPGSGSPLEQMMLYEATAYLPDDILAKVDRAAMAVSLETRVPLLTPELFRFACSLPIDFKIAGREQKRVVRRLLARHVPERLWNHPKQGFGIPIGTWLRGPLRTWADDLLAPASLERSEIFDVAAVDRLWSDHLGGRRDWGSRLWNILTFQAWYEHG